MRSKGEATRYAGVQKIDDKTYRVRFKLVEPRTGKPREVDRVIQAASARDAYESRALLIKEERERRVGDQIRVRVGEYAKSWIESKTACLDKGTADRYGEALDLHILPKLGDFYYDALKPSDVQEWVNKKLRQGWTKKTKKKSEKPNKPKRRSYSVETVRAWFRVFRTMTRD